jgi:hypothetical protein
MNFFLKKYALPVDNKQIIVKNIIMEIKKQGGK